MFKEHARATTKTNKAGRCPALSELRSRSLAGLLLGCVLPPLHFADHVLSGAVPADAVGFDQDIVGVLPCGVVGKAQLLPGENLLLFALALNLQKLGVRPASQLLYLGDDGVDGLSPELELVELAEVLDGELKLAVERGDGEVDGGLREGLWLGAGRACNVGVAMRCLLGATCG